MAVDNPDQLRAEIDAARRRNEQASSTTDPLLRELGLALGGAVAGRRGQTQLFDALATGLTGSQPQPGSASSTSGGGSGSQECRRAVDQMSNDVQQVQTQYSSASVHCVQGPKMADAMERRRPQIVSACRGQPDYDRSMRRFEEDIRAFRQNASKVCNK
jgi:hypothetical protein